MAEKFSTGDVNARATAIQTAYANGVIGIFGGTKPATANDSEGSAPLLALVTLNGGAFTPGSPTNGINLSAPVDGVNSKASGETWSGNGTAAAGTGVTATWFRHYSNAYVTGASTTAVRWDGTIGTTTSYEMQATNTTVVQDVPFVVNSFTRTASRG